MAKEIVINDCRSDFNNFFEISLKYNLKTKFKHAPFIVIDEKSKAISIVDNVEALLNEYGKKPTTKLMKQWTGEWKSDFFNFTVGDLQTAIKNNN